MTTADLPASFVPAARRSAGGRPAAPVGIALAATRCALETCRLRPAG